MTAPSNPPKLVVSQGLHMTRQVDPNCMYNIATTNPTAAPITPDLTTLLARRVIGAILAA